MRQTAPVRGSYLLDLIRPVSMQVREPTHPISRQIQGPHALLTILIGICGLCIARIRPRVVPPLRCRPPPRAGNGQASPGGAPSAREQASVPTKARLASPSRSFVFWSRVALEFALLSRRLLRCCCRRRLLVAFVWHAFITCNLEPCRPSLPLSEGLCNSLGHRASCKRRFAACVICAATCIR